MRAAARGLCKQQSALTIQELLSEIPSETSDCLVMSTQKLWKRGRPKIAALENANAFPTFPQLRLLLRSTVNRHKGICLLKLGTNLASFSVEPYQ